MVAKKTNTKKPAVKKAVEKKAVVNPAVKNECACGCGCGGNCGCGCGCGCKKRAILVQLTTIIIAVVLSCIICCMLNCKKDYRRRDMQYGAGCAERMKEKGWDKKGSKDFKRERQQAPKTETK